MVFAWISACFREFRRFRADTRQTAILAVKKTE